MSDTVAAPARRVPDPGQAPLVAPNATALLRRNAGGGYADRPAVHFEGRTWTYGEFLADARRFAALFAGWRPADPAAPFHVGVLLDNTPDYLAALAGAALAGAALAGLNPTRQGEHLARDIAHVDLAGLLTEPRHAGLLADARAVLPPRVVVSERFDGGDDAFLPGPLDWPDPGPDVGTTWCLVFTSGTSAAPKAVICSQRRLLVTGERLRVQLDVGPDDVGYLSMPLFHSNSLMVGLMPAWLSGASVALRRRFSASGFLPDVRRYGVTYWNYTGKPLAYLLATPEESDDADNSLIRAYGNEGSDVVVARFSRRFGVEVIDAFGPTEGGVGIVRGTGDPAGSLGHAGEAVRVVDEDGQERARARFDEGGRLVNAEDSVGEIVNTAGIGPFEGYYNNPEATARATRGGWYWSGDLGYVDDAGYVYFAGRAADWLRVDGENFPAGPIEAAVARWPDAMAAAVYGVPDADAGDQVMAALVLRPGATFDPAAFTRWLDAQPDLGPKWRPRWVRVCRGLPRTPTNKVLYRRLQHEKFRRDRVGDDEVYRRGPGELVHRPFTPVEETSLRATFAATGRDRFWDL